MSCYRTSHMGRSTTAQGNIVGDSCSTRGAFRIDIEALITFHVSCVLMWGANMSVIIAEIFMSLFSTWSTFFNERFHIWCNHTFKICIRWAASLMWIFKLRLLIAFTWHRLLLTEWISRTYQGLSVIIRFSSSALTLLKTFIAFCSEHCKLSSQVCCEQTKSTYITFINVAITDSCNQLRVKINLIPWELWQILEKRRMLSLFLLNLVELIFSCFSKTLDSLEQCALKCQNWQWPT